MTETPGQPVAGGGSSNANVAKAPTRHRNNNKRGTNNNNNKSRSPKRDGQHNTNNNSNNRNQSKSPMRNNNNSHSPTRDRLNNNNSKSPPRSNDGHHWHQQHHQHHHHHNHHRKHPGKPSAMTVIINRCDLWDSAAQFQPEEWVQPTSLHPGIHVNPYFYEANPTTLPPNDVQVARVPYHMEQIQFPIAKDQTCDVIDVKIPNPHDPSVCHDKYWAQRRRLFSRFDQGIQLDSEGWYSVTPELIADHVAQRVSDLASNFLALQQQQQQGHGVVILDAFCGCGGNSIAFGKLPSHIVSKVVCVDTDRSKLLKAAHNASLYDIPKDKLVFVECNSIFILKYCYKGGEFVLDQPTTTLPQYMPPPVMPTTHAGYQVGGLDMLPRHIDLAFFDPPWGGVDYTVLGKNGYDLEKNMKIRVNPAPCEDPYEGDGDGVDDFFDSFAAPKQHHMSKNARKKNFNKKTEGEFVNGKELIKLAAEATRSRVVLFDLPRNTSKTSLGLCALAAGYRGNIKLEEHYLNGRLKTVTAYMGSDYSSLINDSTVECHVGTSSGDDNED
ncbi:RNA cap guanine-N2 methyltransferase [Nitzschia inconspicua]|uniref:RNA cap guanine-N2 methyltransferase n=1 Tax=Nitzschia inconspicua TaxID=303405 RepID=A0A9K3KNY9_9STRA|nr:RNA cap guanine-N2 methyltransferase [Nitzschia inconspicua]